MTKRTATISQPGGTVTGEAGGNEAAAEFERLYRANVEAVTAYFARRSADPHMVADLTADTFVTAITSFGSFDPGKLADARPVASPRRHGTARRTLVAGGGTLAVAGAIAGTLVAGSGSPAYAVTKNPDGSITIAVYQASGIAGANQRIHQLGDKQVFVVPVKAGCPSISSLPKPPVPARGHRMTTGAAVSRNGSVTSVTAQGIPAGDILVFAVETSGRTTMGEGILTSAPAPSCVSRPAPAPGSGA